ncbi:hypothetical protein FRZ03_25165 [Streptomyces misionensis]|uniref:Uncharacterized protein n=1 Tax=Streptomyces misionensis TaxID=67331 RepID=A0A5C6J6K0_9ACTN|nr:hypothetical protein [Streptomyces misionensis]TWV37168.1 hypothetical protein FRZ03_25165 [Streptomyces misionensis]
MFEIRVICDPADTDRITTALNTAFATGAVRARPTRDGNRTRLYTTADHYPDPQPFPAPEAAYALAPSIISELGWTTHAIATAGCFTELERDYYLRKAALLDRIALLDEPDTLGDGDGDATETALAAALMLLDTDRAHLAPHLVDQAEKDPRGYVRQQYAQHVRCVCDDFGEGDCLLHPDPDH